MVFVHQLMTPDPFFLPPESAVDDAGRILVDRRLHGAPVGGANGSLVGVVSLLDLAAARKRALDGSPTTVGDLMTRNPVTVQPGEGIYEAARAMVQHRIHRVIVVDESNRAVGVLTPTDILVGMVNLEGGFRLRSLGEQGESRERNDS
jgi:CBS domain-containing protein